MARQTKDVLSSYREKALLNNEKKKKKRSILSYGTSAKIKQKKQVYLFF